MKLKLFKTLWGFKSTYAEAVRLAMQQGYEGIEGPVPPTQPEAEQFAELLRENNLLYIAEVATAGAYVPNRRLSLTDHIQDLQDNLQRLQPLHPLFITCLGGCDAWPVSESVVFFDRAMEFAAKSGHNISFETHRGRSLFNPWNTLNIVRQLPELKLTCDFSHWCVVCEGLQATEEKIIRTLLPNAWHIHGRVGYDQGPQVPDPRTGLYAEAMRTHQKWWQWIWEEHHRQGREITTLTPEFGPDGYHYRDPVSGTALVDLDQINGWVAHKLRSQFAGAFNGRTEMN